MSIMFSLSVLVHLPPSLTGYGNGPLTALPVSTLLLAVHCPCPSQNEFHQMQTRRCHSRAESFQRLPSILRRKCGFLSPMVCDLPLPHQPPSPYSLLPSRDPFTLLLHWPPSAAWSQRLLLKPRDTLPTSFHRPLPPPSFVLSFRLNITSSEKLPNSSWLDLLSLLFVT